MSVEYLVIIALRNGYGNVAPAPCKDIDADDVEGCERKTYAATEPTIIAIATIAIMIVYLLFIFSILLSELLKKTARLYSEPT